MDKFIKRMAFKNGSLFTIVFVLVIIADYVKILKN